MQPDATARRVDLDWLKVIATLAVFGFHCARFFDEIPWEVKNPQQSTAFTLVVVLLAQWIMPLFFVLSGASIACALRVRTAGHFVRERGLRIMLPYLTVGLLLLIPPQEYIAALTSGTLDPATPWGQFYLSYLGDIRLFGSDFPWLALPLMHLWYLPYLFLFSLLLLPLFLWLRTARGKQVVGAMARASALPGVALLAALPVAALMTLLDPQSWGRDNGGWAYLVYPVFLIYGFLLFSDERFLPVIRRNGLLALLVVVITTPAVLLLFQDYMRGIIAYGSADYALLMGIRALNNWGWIIGWLYLGQRFLTAHHPLLRYSSEAALPFYLLHQTVIVIIAFLLVDWHVAILPKYLVLASTSLLIIVGGYDLLIRRNNLMRLLFGLKPRPRTVRALGEQERSKAQTP